MTLHTSGCRYVQAVLDGEPAFCHREKVKGSAYCSTHKSMTVPYTATVPCVLSCPSCGLPHQTLREFGECLIPSATPEASPLSEIAPTEPAPSATLPGQASVTSDTLAHYPKIYYPGGKR